MFRKSVSSFSSYQLSRLFISITQAHFSTMKPASDESTERNFQPHQETSQRFFLRRSFPDSAKIKPSPSSPTLFARLIYARELLARGSRGIKFFSPSPPDSWRRINTRDLPLPWCDSVFRFSSRARPSRKITMNSTATRVRECV